MSMPRKTSGMPVRLSVADPPSAPRWTPFERASGVLLMALISTLALEWISLGSFLTRNVKHFHLVALAFMAFYLARYRPRRRLGRILGRYSAFYGPWIFYLLLVSVIGLAHTEPYFLRSEVVRQAFYGAVSVFVAAFFLDVDGRNVRRILQWTGVAVVVVVVAGIGLALLGQGMNPLRLIADALAKGDPDIMSQLLRRTFRSQEATDAAVNLRHKVFSAVLIGCAVTLICREPPRGIHSRWRDRLLLASAAIGALLAVLSLSRSVSLCLVIVLVLYSLRALIKSERSPWQLAPIVAILVVTVVLAASPLGLLVSNRATVDTGSYQGRLASLWSAIQPPASVDAAILGVEASEVASSPHNLVLDAWLSAGVLGAVATALFLLAYLRVWLREARRYLTGGPGWRLSLHQFWVAAVGVIPLVRAFTAGNGFHLNDWVCVGIVFGLGEANRQARGRPRGHHATLLHHRRPQTLTATGGGVPSCRRP